MSNEDLVQELKDRIEVLEKVQKKRKGAIYTGYWLGLIACIALLNIYVVNPLLRDYPVAEVIRAKKFEVVNDEGWTTVQMDSWAGKGNDWNSGVWSESRSGTGSAPNGCGRLVFFDDAGHCGLQMGWLKGNTSGIQILTSSWNGALLGLYRPSGPGNERVEIRSPGHNADGIPGISFGSIATYDSDGKLVWESPSTAAPAKPDGQVDPKHN